MTITYVTSNSVGPGVRIKRYLDDEDLVINSGVLVSSQDGIALYCYASYHDVTVQGQIEGAVYGIVLGNDMSVDAFNSVIIEAGGSVSATVDAVRFKSASGSLINYGKIYGVGESATNGSDGVVIGGMGTGISVIKNYGLIQAKDQGIEVNNDTTETVMLENYGTISGITDAYVGDINVDQVINRGTMHGNIFLKEGNDLYDGRSGSVLGHDGTAGSIYGGDGKDTFLPGNGAEVISGSTGYDTLDFRDSDGLRVSLVDASGTGSAVGDVYSGIERIWGSRTGADTLIGNSSDNRLEGWGGDDTLTGGSGHDALNGGVGADSLNGGWGNDAFEFHTLQDCGDVINDFTNSFKNDDHFRISASGFGGGFVAGATVDPTALQTRTDNVAQDSDDRFIFCTTDQTLWYDSNGNDAGGLTLVADLQSTATVTSADILLV